MRIHVAIEWDSECHVREDWLDVEHRQTRIDIELQWGDLALGILDLKKKREFSRTEKRGITSIHFGLNDRLLTAIYQLRARAECCQALTSIFHLPIEGFFFSCSEYRFHLFKINRSVN